MSFICSIYESRPDVCREYPRLDDYLPRSCTYFFMGNGTRKGKCSSECEAACCMLPRKDGEPGGGAMPEIAGGLPCKHLRYVKEDADFGDSEDLDNEKVKEGSSSSFCCDIDD